MNEYDNCPESNYGHLYGMRDFVSRCIRCGFRKPHPAARWEGKPEEPYSILNDNRCIARADWGGQCWYGTGKGTVATLCYLHKDIQMKGYRIRLYERTEG